MCNSVSASGEAGEVRTIILCVVYKGGCRGIDIIGMRRDVELKTADDVDAILVYEVLGF